MATWREDRNLTRTNMKTIYNIRQIFHRSSPKNVIDEKFEVTAEISAESAPEALRIFNAEDLADPCPSMVDPGETIRDFKVASPTHLDAGGIHGYNPPITNKSYQAWFEDFWTKHKTEIAKARTLPHIDQVKYSMSLLAHKGHRTMDICFAGSFPGISREDVYSIIDVLRKDGHLCDQMDIDDMVWRIQIC